MSKTSAPVKAPRGRPKKSAIALGAKQTARVSARRAIKSTIGQTSMPPIAKLAATAAIGAIIAYFINNY